MRHRKARFTLDRKAGPRRALLRSLAVSMVEHGRVRTTRAKAKAVQPMVERAVTVGKRGDLTARRMLIATLGSQKAAERILTTWSPAMRTHVGGCTRIIKMGFRAGDGAEQVVLEFIHGA